MMQTQQQTRKESSSAMTVGKFTFDTAPCGGMDVTNVANPLCFSAYTVNIEPNRKLMSWNIWSTCIKRKPLPILLSHVHNVREKVMVKKLILRFWWVYTFWTPLTMEKKKLFWYSLWLFVYLYVWMDVQKETVLAVSFCYLE